MNELVFKIVFIVLWVIYILIRAPFTTPYKQVQKIKVVGESTEKVLLSILSVGLLFVPMVWALSPWLNRFTMNIPLWARYIGIAISIVSLFYFHYIHKALGKNWSPKTEIFSEHRLVTTGPYKRLRHPMYAQGWLWTIAQIFIVSNYIAGFSGVIAWAILYFIRVPREEKMLMGTFGEEYKEYVNKTGRVFPKL